MNSIPGLEEGSMLNVSFPKVIEKEETIRENKMSNMKIEEETPKKENKIEPEKKEEDEKNKIKSETDREGVIKHQAFDQFLKENFGHIINPKQKSGSDIPLQSRSFLKEFSYSYVVNRNCKNHEPYPKAMCSACLPPSIHMKRQIYRHVDYAQIMNGEEIGNLIRHWFNVGTQRVGYLYGYYAEDPTYSLGVRAVVEAIYEPQQKNDFNHSIIMSDRKLHFANRIAESLGMQRIGYVFTTYNNDVFLTSDEVNYFILLLLLKSKR